MDVVPPAVLDEIDTSLKLGSIPYRDGSHVDLPHILSFSGGRSSAALALLAAKEGLLKPERGDILVFGNTSAEHPGTYDFAAECKRRIENEFGLPVFWYEFCTVEDSFRGAYRRRDAYRLVKPVPVETDPDGYRSKGEVFEEMLSWQGMLPNPFQRTCTVKLKLFPAHKLIADWLGGMPGPARAGHHWDASLIDSEEYADKYEKRGGNAPREQVLRRAQYLSELPTSRAAQNFGDYTNAHINSFGMNSFQKPRPAVMRGKDAAEHVRLLGLRADEPKRVMRVLDRCLLAEGATTSKCTVSTQPPGERPYFPLYDAGIESDDIMSFWAAQDFDLDIPANAGNCTFCFMKGTEKIIELSNTHDPRRRLGTPSHIGWWADVEQRHMRTVPKRNGAGTTTFGFFSANSGTFEDLIGGDNSNFARHKTGTPACDCTD